jgi:hypothetical protein
MVRGLLIIAPAALLLAVVPSPGGQQKAATAPQYNDKGELLKPTDYQSWVFVGSNLGLQYGKEVVEKDREKERANSNPGTFHNVYINPEAYQAYVKTGKFPDGTILMMEVYEAVERGPQKVVTKGFYPGKFRSVEAAVKNSKRPDGSKTDWAYYDFGAKRTSAGAFPDNACYQCHRQHASDDNVWVQFYPVLGQHKKTPAR